jgi:hypothetical protein
MWSARRYITPSAVPNEIHLNIAVQCRIRYSSEVNNCSAWNQEDRSEDSSVRKGSTERHPQKIVFGLCAVVL